MAKIIGGTTSTPMRVPDWNQTDSTKSDYIKNKPFDKVDAALDADSTNPVQNKALAVVIGDIDAALDGIIVIQNSLIGGESV